MPEHDAAGTHGRPLPVAFLLPDEMWDERRAWPYLDRLSMLGVAVVELWPDQEHPFGLPEAQAAIAAMAEGLGLDAGRVALLGFGAGGRIALSLASPVRSAVALYPACQGASAPDREARVMVLHPDDPVEARACAALTESRRDALSGNAAPGAGHGWDVPGERNGGSILVPHPDAPNTVGRRLAARPDAWATFRAARAVSTFLLNGPSPLAYRGTP